LERAARLLGAAAPLRHDVGWYLNAADRVDYDRNLAAVRAQLDEATFTTAWEVGRAMTLEQAIAEALEPLKGDLHGPSDPALPSA
jgi:hypothetical protein